MGYWTNIVNALLGREPKPVVQEAIKKTPITPITVRKKKPGRRKGQRGKGLTTQGFKPLTKLERTSIKQTYDELHPNASDLSYICGVSLVHAKYLLRRLELDEHWADVTELSQYIDKEDVQMLYCLSCISKGNDQGVARLFGITKETMHSYFKKMSEQEKAEAKKYLVMPVSDRSTPYSMRFNIDRMTDAEAAHLLRCFRKAVAMCELRYIVPEYQKYESSNFGAFTLRIYSHLLKREQKNEKN